VTRNKRIFVVVGEDTNNGCAEEEMPLVRCPHHQLDLSQPLAWCPHHQREISVVVGGDTNNGFAEERDAAGLVSSPPAGDFGGCWWGHQQRLRRVGRCRWLGVLTTSETCDCRWLGAYTPSGRFRWLLVGSPTMAAPGSIKAFSSRG